MAATCLTPEQLDAFARDGFVRVPGAVPREIARQCAEILWAQLGVDPDVPSSWPGPVVRAGTSGPPFDVAANTPVLLAAFDQLVGPGAWVPRTDCGLVVARFPSSEEPGDTGWHVELSFHPEGMDWPGDGNWRTNVASRGRALLMLFLFTDVGPDDAPTRVRVGSHLDVPAVLAPAGEYGLRDAGVESVTRSRTEALATGEAGDVYLCHPFLVHAAQPHHGMRPRLMAQPGLDSVVPFALAGRAEECHPVEAAILRGLGR
jgi:hypothetical protein